MKYRIKARVLKKIAADLLALFALILILTSVGYSLDKKGNAQVGKVVFEKNCIGCHGKKGEGLGEMSKLPNFTNPKAMMDRSDQELFDKITNGGGRGTGMPAWGPLLSEQDRWNLVSYIRTLSSASSK